MGEREDSVRKCHRMFPSSHQLQKGQLFPLVETPTWLCEAARSTASLYGTFSRSVTTSMSFLCLATVGVLILAFSLCSSPASSHPSLKFPYACDLKIVTGLPWESFQFLIFCVVVSCSSLPSTLYLIMRSWRRPRA